MAICDFPYSPTAAHQLLKAHFRLGGETYTLEGQVESNNGNVVDIKGSLYTAGENNPTGTWEVASTTTGLAKKGSFTITKKHLFGIVVHGSLAGMTPQPSDSTAIFGSAYVPLIKGHIPISGTYDQSGNSITFSFSYAGRSFTATGTFLTKGKVSGHLMSGGAKVGTWNLHNL